MFKYRVKQKHTIDDLYDLFISYINQQAKKIEDLEGFRRLAEKNNVELAKTMEIKNKLIEVNKQKITDLETKNQIKEKEIKKLQEKIEKSENTIYNQQKVITKTTEEIISAQRDFLQRRKPKKADFIAEGMYKMDDTTKARLK